MAKKKKIRMEFDKYFREGDEERMKAMLQEHPWLLEEWQSRMDDTMENQREVIAALGVMEDELVGPVPVDEIAYCLRVDFQVTKSEEEILEILREAADLGYVKQLGQGWGLTVEGGKLCDNFLNTRMGSLASDVE
ncbi:MAG: hypothetical protein Kow0069_38950 [Promethearchaeota archaeon]